jgi:spore coat protein CotF
MDLKDIVAVTGLSGLYKSAAKRNDGMIITSLETGKTTFASARVHMFTPLDTITVYIENNDTIELVKILAEMKKQEKTNAVPDSKADNPTLKTYFKKVLPNYDEEKVYFSDISKILKWYKLLDSKGLVDTNVEKPKEEEVKEEAQHAAEAKPKSKEAAPPKKAGTPKAASSKAPTGAKSTVQKLTNQSKRGG